MVDLTENQGKAPCFSAEMNPTIHYTTHRSIADRIFHAAVICAFK